MEVKVHRNGIAQRICPDRSEAVRLGHVTVDIMNRMPGKKDLSTFTKGFTGQSLSHARKFVALAALVHRSRI